MCCVFLNFPCCANKSERYFCVHIFNRCSPLFYILFTNVCSLKGFLCNWIKKNFFTLIDSQPSQKNISHISNRYAVYNNFSYIYSLYNRCFPNVDKQKSHLQSRRNRFRNNSYSLWNRNRFTHSTEWFPE